MSIKAWGTFEIYKPNILIHKKTELAFEAMINAAQNKIGLKLGGNVEAHILRNVGQLGEKIPFELTDDPLEVNAHCLFIGDGIEVVVAGNRVDTGESLETRMVRVQNFFDKMLNNKIIKGIELNINIEDGDKVETVEVNINSFSNKMLELYKKEGNRTPTVKVIIT